MADFLPSDLKTRTVLSFFSKQKLRCVEILYTCVRIYFDFVCLFAFAIPFLQRDIFLFENNLKFKIYVTRLNKFVECSFFQSDDFLVSFFTRAVLALSILNHPHKELY